MEGVDPSLLETFPNMAMTPAEIMQGELLRDLGNTQKDYTRAVTEITSAQ